MSVCSAVVSIVLEYIIVLWCELENEYTVSTFIYIMNTWYYMMHHIGYTHGGCYSNLRTLMMMVKIVVAVISTESMIKVSTEHDFQVDELRSKCKCVQLM